MAFVELLSLSFHIQPIELQSLAIAVFFARPVDSSTPDLPSSELLLSGAIQQMRVHHLAVRFGDTKKLDLPQLKPETIGYFDSMLNLLKK